MRTMSKLLIPLLILIASYETLFAQTDDVAAIKTELNKWMTAYNQKNLDNSVSIFAENYIGFYSGHPDQTVNSIKEQNDQVFKNKYLKATLSMEVVEIETGGDIAYVSVKQKWSFKPSIMDKAQIAFEKGILIFKKQLDGKWRIIRSSTFPVNATK
ncbi:hypothetical protein C0389_09355 [bacterium]|nr:hypothetical protein [bacterium]